MKVVRRRLPLGAVGLLFLLALASVGLVYGNWGQSLSINGTNETWFAAIDKSYNTFVFVDDFREIRANNTPELNFGFGVRENTP